MELSAHELSSVSALLERMHDAVPGELQLEPRRLGGGLETAGIARVAARWRDRRGRSRVFTLVLKRLSGPAAREALVYERLVAPHASGLAPRLLASDRPASDRAVLYLEALRPVRAWPWRETGAARTVLERAAGLHTTSTSRATAALLATWDYEGELLKSAELTLDRLERARRRPGLACVGRALPSVRRLIGVLPAMRRQLAAFAPFGSGPIHGDLHPGNAVMRRLKGREETVLLDWGRTRIGSPLEDVSCWLQSLVAWEPEARRRHDTLLADYLSTRGMERRLGSDLRAAYWLAGASNALSGALSHHLWVALDDGTTGARRARAVYSAREWMRVLRRADAFWR